MNTKWLHFALLLTLQSFVFSQVNAQVAINSTSSLPNASAMLDVSSTSRGFLAPRMTQAQRVAISTPAEALLVYQTDGIKGFYYYTGSAWNYIISGSATQWTTSGSDIYYTTGNVGIGTTTPGTALHVNGTNPLTLGGLQAGTASDSILTVSNGVVKRISPSLLTGSSTSYWSKTGNTGSPSGSYFLGTTDNTSLRFRANNTQSFMLDSLGNAAIGASPTFTASPNREKFLVDAGTTTSYNVISGKGTINNYLQLNIQNKSNGTAASSDVVATADNGDETTGFVDLGINGSGNTSTGVLGGAGTGYLYSTGNDFAIGNSTASKNLSFFTGGTASSNERLRIDGNGNVGIGTTTPGTVLHVNGTNPLTLGGLQSGTNADSVLTVSNGVIKRLSPSALATSSTNAWALLGNTGTVSGSHFIGTIDNKSLRFRTNNTQSFMLDSLGNAAIGASPTFTASPNREKLLVDAGTTTSFNVISGKGTINNYLQLNIQNKSNGTAASSDVVATADNGDESTGFVDLGINSSGNTSTGVIGGAGTGYLYSTGNDFAIGNSTASKNLSFFTGGTASANERLRIDGNGNVGIGTTSTSNTLHVNGTNPLKLGGLQSGTAGDSVLTVSNGIVKRISPSTFSTSASNSWLKTGNTGTPSGSYFIGTTDNSSLRFRTNNTEQFVIDSLGNVGIGSSDFDPTQPERLLIDGGTYGSNGSTPAITVFGAVGNTNNYVQAIVTNSAYGNNSSSDFVVQADGTRNGTVAVGTDNFYLDFGINSSGYNTNNSNILNQTNTPYLYASAPQDFFIGQGYSGKSLVFFTNSGSTNANNTADGAEVMRLTSAKKVLIGTTTAATELVNVNGAIRASAFNVSSDRRLKTNIKNLNYGLKQIMALQPVSYNWIDTAADKTKQLGLIAQDVKKVVPEIVAGDETKEKLAVNYTELIPVLINAVKEQQKQIEAQQKQIEELKLLVQKKAATKK